MYWHTFVSCSAEVLRHTRDIFCSSVLKLTPIEGPEVTAEAVPPRSGVSFVRAGVPREVFLYI